jgi:hypothetical protein
MNKISEYDERQLNLMLNQLDAFENKKLDLSSLVGRLEGLLHSMEHVTDEWEEKFLDEFSMLESINAEAPKLKEEEIEKLIKSSIWNLKKLVKGKLNDLTEHENN